MEKIVARIGLIWLLFWIYTGVCWIINLIQFVGCDFESPWKEEVIKLIGILVFPTAGITVWF